MKPWKFWLVLLVACASLPVGGYLIGQLSSTWAIVAFCVGFFVVVALKVSDALRARKTERADTQPRFDSEKADVAPLDEARADTVDDDLPPAA